jgi:hypothetical protein
MLAPLPLLPVDVAPCPFPGLAQVQHQVRICGCLDRMDLHPLGPGADGRPAAGQLGLGRQYDQLCLRNAFSQDSTTDFSLVEDGHPEVDCQVSDRPDDQLRPSALLRLQGLFITPAHPHPHHWHNLVLKIQVKTE